MCPTTPPTSTPLAREQRDGPAWNESGRDGLVSTAPRFMPGVTDTAEVRSGISDRRGWVAVWSVALGSFVLVLSEFLPIGLLPAIADDLQISIGIAGLLVVATGLMGAIGAPVVTVLTSRVDRRIVLWSLTALLVVSDVLGAIAPNLVVLLVARMLLGLAIGGFWSIGAGIASRLVRDSAVIRATSIITAGVSVATVVSLPLGAFVSAVATWRTAFFIGAGSVWWRCSCSSSCCRASRRSSACGSRPSAGCWRSPAPASGLIATALAFIAQFSAYTYVAPYLQQLVHLTPEVITVALLAFGIAGIAGNFVAGITLSRNVTGTLAVTKVVLALAVVSLPLLAWSLPGVFVLPRDLGIRLGSAAARAADLDVAGRARRLRRQPRPVRDHDPARDLGRLDHRRAGRRHVRHRVRLHARRRDRGRGAARAALRRAAAGAPRRSRGSRARGLLRQEKLTSGWTPRPRRVDRCGAPESGGAPPRLGRSTAGARRSTRARRLEGRIASNTASNVCRTPVM